MTRSDYNKSRENDLRKLILRTLSNTPDDYLMPEDSLLSTVRFARDPEYTQAELDRAQEWLETEELIYCHRDVLAGTSWAITPKGRSRASKL